MYKSALLGWGVNGLGSKKSGEGSCVVGSWHHVTCSDRIAHTSQSTSCRSGVQLKTTRGHRIRETTKREN